MENKCNKKTLDALEGYINQLDDNIGFADYLNELIHYEEELPLEIIQEYATPLKEEKFRANPYYLLCDKIKGKMGKYQLCERYYAPRQVFLKDEFKVVKEENYKEVTDLGYFENEFPYPCLMESDFIWMSVTPHEINTMENPIREAKGVVLVFGLGMGYYQFMISNKPEVKEVIIIEKEKEIIGLFKEHLLPHFPHKEKIKIIEKDAFDLLKEGGFAADFAFVDIYRQPLDALPLYLKMKPLEKNLPHTKFAYWIEESILIMLRRALLILIYEELTSTFEKRKGKEFEDRLINSLHDHYKKETIESLKDIDRLLSNENLRQLATNLSI
ncbi:MAG: hypothetical protein K5694_02560 [Bacilli bacterium]|nr:hypothetical protein [Bacilli bacterium]